MKPNGDAGKDPRQLEQEVDEQRRQIGDTIHALEEKFSSRAIYDQAAGAFREHGRDFAQSFGSSIKANPLPVALTSIGLLWMMVGQRRPVEYRSRESHDVANDLYGNNTSVYGHQGSESGKEKMQSGMARAKGGLNKVKGKGEELRGRAGSARQQASAASHDLRDKASATGHQLRDSAGHARERMSHSMDSARSNFEHYMHEQPLALGAIGIALGALVGASLPRTRREEQALGDINERARRKASEMAEQGYEKASEVGESVRREAQETLHSQRHSEQRTSPENPEAQGPSTTP